MGQMDKTNVWGNILYLVCLKVTYEVPLNILGQHLVFLLKFLYMTLTKHSMSASIGFLYHTGRVKLAYGHQLDIGWESLLNLLDYLRWVLHLALI